MRDTARAGLFSSFKLSFVRFNMAAYTLPEGFTEFDMFTFGSALLVGGKWPVHTGRHVSIIIKGPVHPEIPVHSFIFPIVMFEI